jgi:predicted porin
MKTRTNDPASNERINVINSVRGESNVKKSVLCTAVLASLAGVAFSSSALAADDGSLTWNGITLYGVVDIGVAYQTHGAPLSQDWAEGIQYLLAKSSNKSITTVAPSGLSQSRIGVRGKENVTEGVDFVFNAEMGFNPTSGKLSDGPKSLLHNNGVALSEQTSAADSSRAGQFFNGQAYGGFASPTWGTLTIGRHNTILLDDIGKYDPMNGSYAFSVLGASGTTAGGGDTEDARWDDSVKYAWKYDWFHLGAMYGFGKTDTRPGEAWQGDVGGDFGPFSVDGVYAKTKDAVALASLSAAQIAGSSTTPALPNDSLAATISDNESWTLDASYSFDPFKIYGGFEHIDFKNPSLPLAVGTFTGQGGYFVSVVNNAAFPHTKQLDVSWGGLKWLVSKDFDITGAVYHYDQNAYGATKCSNTSEGNCSGSEWAYSVRFDYRWTKRFDTYAGAMYSKVENGLANGYLKTNTVDPMIGFRFQF